MANSNYPSFDQKAITEALEAGQRHGKNLRAVSDAGAAGGAGQSITLDNGELKLSAQCISVSVNNGQVCLNLPLGIGSICIPVPSWIPSGATVQACLDICTKWGIPCGVEVTGSFNGTRIFQKGFGCC